MVDPDLSAQELPSASSKAAWFDLCLAHYTTETADSKAALDTYERLKERHGASASDVTDGEAVAISISENPAAPSSSSSYGATSDDAGTVAAAGMAALLLAAGFEPADQHGGTGGGGGGWALPNEPLAEYEVLKSQARAQSHRERSARGYLEFDATVNSCLKEHSRQVPGTDWGKVT
jgi:hypothetical protein